MTRGNDIHVGIFNPCFKPLADTPSHRSQSWFNKSENYPPFSGLLALPLSGESTFELEGDDSGLLDIVGLKALGGRVPTLVGLGEYPADLRECPADLRCEFLFEPRFSFFDPVRAFFRIICVLPSSHILFSYFELLDLVRCRRVLGIQGTQPQTILSVYLHQSDATGHRSPGRN